jgi:hypothetical protein
VLTHKVLKTLGYCNFAHVFDVGFFVQQVTIQPPATPGGPVIVTQTPAGVPQTRAQLDQLHYRREQLREQVNGLGARREALRNDLKIATDSDTRAELQTRIKEVSARIVRIDDEIDRTSDLIASAPASALRSQTAVDPGRIADRIARDLVPLAGIFSVFVLFPLTLALVRLIWRRGSAPRPAIADSATNERLQQIQQSIDTIAVEVERISENQRFVTKMMSDRALGAGSAEPVRAPLKSAVPAERG